jgi:TPR repeat protein
MPRMRNNLPGVSGRRLSSRAAVLDANVIRIALLGTVAVAAALLAGCIREAPASPQPEEDAVPTASVATVGKTALPPDDASPHAWLVAMADRDDARAMYYLGNAHRRAADGEAARPMPRTLEMSDQPYWFRSEQLVDDPAFAGDHRMAVTWYERAAKQGHAAAMRCLGDALTTGIGVTRDLDEATRWYRHSAAIGDRDAMYRIRGAQCGRGLALAAAGGQRRSRRCDGPPG